MTRALNYATGQATKPVDLQLLQTIERLGVEAVLGRVLTVNESRRMLAADAIVKAWRSRTASGNWAEWTNANPDAAALLARAESDD